MAALLGGHATAHPPHSSFLLFHFFWGLKCAQSFCAFPGDPIFLLYPIAWEGPMTEVSAQAQPCIPASQHSSVQVSLTQACLHAAVFSEKSEAFVCKGAAGKLSILISQPVVYSVLPYIDVCYMHRLCLSGTFPVGVSCICSPTKLTCCMQVQRMAFQLKSWVMLIMEMFGSSLCHLQHLVYSAQLGAPSEATLLVSCSSTFQPNGEGVLCSLGTQLEHIPSQHCHLDLESCFQRSGSIPNILVTQRLCIWGEVFKNLNPLLMSVCSFVVISQCLSRINTVASMSLRCMLYLHKSGLFRVPHA